MDLYLEQRETELLMRLLEHRLEDLQHEIHHTDTRAFKADLKADEALLRGILGKLKVPANIGI